MQYVMFSFGRSVGTLDGDANRQDIGLAFSKIPPRSTFSYHQLFCPAEPVGCGVNEAPTPISGIVNVIVIGPTHLI